MYVPVTEIVRGIFRIGPIETGRIEANGVPSGPTSPYLVLGKDRALIAEPGEDGQRPALLEGLRECNVDLKDIAYVWASHIHLHHVQGVPQLLKVLPNAKFLVHPRGAPHVIEPTRLIQSTIEVWGDKCYGKFEPIPREKVMPVDDNQIIDLGRKQLQVIHAVGHAPHHMGLLDLETRALFSGDIAMLSLNQERAHSDIRPPLFDLDKFLDSVHRYQALDPKIMLSFRHGGVSHLPQQTLRWVEEDHLIIEKICEDGMRRNRSFKEIVQDMEKYAGWIGTRPPGREGETAEFAGGGLYGMINYVKRKHPELPMPADSTKRLRGGLG